MFKSGFVTIVGKPNSGKSTLLNRILNKKVAISTPKKNTTRNRIRGIFNDDNSQIIFTDTPGFLKSKSKLDDKMLKHIRESMKGVDVILFLIPFWNSFDNEYLKRIEFFGNSSAKKYLLLTKIDKLGKNDETIEKISSYASLNIFSQIIPISSTRHINIDKLITLIKDDLSEDVPYYDRNQLTEYTTEFYASEIIREKALLFLEDEVPHEIFVKIVHKEESKKLWRFSAEIIVARDGLKGIILGKNGATLKRIVTSARIELEKQLDKKVFIETFIKVRKNWKDETSIIQEI